MSCIGFQFDYDLTRRWQKSVKMIFRGLLVIAVFYLPQALGQDEGVCPCLQGLEDVLKRIADSMGSTEEKCEDAIEETDEMYSDYNSEATYVVGDTVNVNCKRGYKPKDGGENFRKVTCLHNGKWSKVLQCKSACPSPFTLYGNGLCYFHRDKYTNYWTAVLFCAKKKPAFGSRLVMPNTASKQKDLIALGHSEGWFGDDDSKKRSLWLGAGDRLEEGYYMWDEGSQLRLLDSTFHWDDTEPNNLNDDEHCIHIYSDGQLNDIPCRYVLGGNAVCEIPL